MRIVLASASPRRKELLTQIGLDFEILVSQVDEVITQTMPGNVVEELSAQKARAVADSIREKGETPALVIGADTVVACDDKILGKPKSAKEAEEMLKMLQGRAHAVYTGVTLINQVNGKEISFHEKTLVHFCPMTEAEIAEYVATKDPMDKAGAYGIQGFCARYISGIEGDYNNVVGLPVCRLYQEMKKLI